MALSWLPEFLADIKQTYDLINMGYLKNVTLTGSSSLIYLICNHEHFNDDIHKYLSELGYSETNKPNDINFCVTSNTAIVTQTFNPYVAVNESPSRRKIYRYNNKSFDIRACKSIERMFINDIYIVHPLSLLFNYKQDDECDTNDKKINFLNKYTNKFNGIDYTIEYFVKSSTYKPFQINHLDLNL